MRYLGPIGARDEGSDATSGPSSRSPRARKAAERPDDDWRRPTTDERNAREKAAQRSGSGIYDYWVNAMREPLHGRSSSASTERGRFAANVRHLIDKEGLTKEVIKTKIDEFARQVSTGQIDVHMKQPWSVFMGCWSRLGGSASTEGLAKKQATLRREDWL